MVCLKAILPLKYLRGVGCSSLLLPRSIIYSRLHLYAFYSEDLNELYFSFSSFCIMSQVVLLIPTSSQYERKFDTVSRTWPMIRAGWFMSFSLAIVPCQVSYRIAPQDDFDCISVHFLPPFLFWAFHIFSGSITLAMGIRFVKEISNPTASNKSRK